jgi:hypothetical protein
MPEMTLPPEMTNRETVAHRFLRLPLPRRLRERVAAHPPADQGGRRKAGEQKRERAACQYDAASELYVYFMSISVLQAMETQSDTLRGALWTVPDCVRLTARHARLKLLYAKAVDRLFATGYLVEDAEYARLKASAEEARVQLEIAEAELDNHKHHVHDAALSAPRVRTPWRA